MPTAALSLRGVSKTYRRGERVVQAVRDATMEIAPGSFTVISGPSGSGKSTLLLLCGLMDTPDSGELRHRGEDLGRADEPARARARLDGIGFVFQESYLVPSLTAAGNVALPMKAAGLPQEERERRVADLLARVSLRGRDDHYPHELSGGQQQMVGVARALANRPYLVLADEPTAGLDPEAAQRVLSLLAEVALVDGAAVIMVSHAPAAPLDARRVRLADGRLSEEPRA